MTIIDLRNAFINFINIENIDQEECETIPVLFTATDNSTEATNAALNVKIFPIDETGIEIIPSENPNSLKEIIAEIDRDTLMMTGAESIENLEESHYEILRGCNLDKDYSINFYKIISGTGVISKFVMITG